MRAALFSIVPDERPPAGPRGWPVAAADYSAEVARPSMERALEYFELADEIGFDWGQRRRASLRPRIADPQPDGDGGRRHPARQAGAEFAAANRLSAGLAVTTVARARDSVAVYREAARRQGWDPAPEQILYRAAIHVAPSDEEAWADCAPFATPDRPVGALSMANPAIDEAVAGAGYYGRDTAHQRQRIMAAGDLRERMDTGQILAGTPATVLAQAAAIQRELGAGILELAFIGPTPDKRRRSIELFGAEVLPRMREL